MKLLLHMLMEIWMQADGIVARCVGNDVPAETEAEVAGGNLSREEKAFEKVSNQVSTDEPDNKLILFVYTGATSTAFS